MNYILLLITCMMLVFVLSIFIGALLTILKTRKIMNSYDKYENSYQFIKALLATSFSLGELEEIEYIINELNERDDTEEDKDYE